MASRKVATVTMKNTTHSEEENASISVFSFSSWSSEIPGPWTTSVGNCTLVQTGGLLKHAGDGQKYKGCFTAKSFP